MLWQQYEEWRNNPDNNSMLGDENSSDNFSIFYQQYSVGKGWFEMMADLAYQIAELQTIAEGLIEDLES